MTHSVVAESEGRGDVSEHAAELRRLDVSLHERVTLRVLVTHRKTAANKQCKSHSCTTQSQLFLRSKILHTLLSTIMECLTGPYMYMYLTFRLFRAPPSCCRAQRRSTPRDLDASSGHCDGRRQRCHIYHRCDLEIQTILGCSTQYILLSLLLHIHWLLPVTTTPERS